MPSHYDDEKPMEEKPKKSTGKMSDKQKADFSKTKPKMEKGGRSKSEMKSHRMKMMVRMRKGMSVNKAHKDISK